MKIIEVKTGKPYLIYIGNGLLSNAGEIIRKRHDCQRALIISDSNVAPLYLDKLRQEMQRNGFLVSDFIFEAGEQSKNLSTIEKIYEKAADEKITRKDIIVALGGGVAGDMAGFAASTWLRGIDFVQIPTSLLAQVDSSVGGKTGVDLPQGKNLVGAFHQPSIVIIDPLTLKTLPANRFSEGMAEVIKYGCIRDKCLFEELKNGFDEGIISACINIKREVVENDEFECSERMLLNFGHTLGHAAEKCAGYENLTHGQGVAVGMMMILKAGEKAGLTKKGCSDRLRMILKKYDLPESIEITKEQLAKASLLDKKSAGDSINLILLKDIGDAFIYKIDKSELLNFIKD